MKKCVFELSINDNKLATAVIQGDWIIGNVVPVFEQVKQQLQVQKCQELKL